MIPLKLELKNFLSYGEKVQTIDFKDFSLICFSGKNGNGKSALLDAITWAVWGQARKISGTIKPDAGLLRLGQTQMVVSFEFEFNTSIYRVRREYAKTYGKPFVALDLEVFDESQKRFVSLTDKTIRQTQLKIEKLLGLDYETYVNSAFLRQGQANEFSQKTPKERKQILANILGLFRYEELQQAAQEQVRSLGDEKKLIVKLQEQADLEIAKEKELKQLLEKDKKYLEQINKEGKKLQEKQQKIEKNKEEFFKQKQELLALERDQNSCKKQQDNKLNLFKSVVREWKAIHYKALLLPNLQELEKEKEKLHKQEKDLLALQQKSLTLQEQVLKEKEVFQKKVYEQKFIIESIDRKTKKEKELKDNLKKLQKELLNIDKKLKEKAKFEKGLRHTINQFEKRRSFYQVLIQKGNWVKAQIDELQQKSKTIQAQKSPACPLCEQVLTIKRKQFLGLKFNKDFNFLSYRFSRISGLIKKLKELLLVQHEEVKKLQKQQDIFNKLELQLKELQEKSKKVELELKQFEKEINSLQKQEKQIEQNLKKDNLLKKLEKELADLKYDKKVHLQLQKKLAAIDKSLKELEIIKQDLQAQKERKNNVVQLAKELKELKNLIVQIEQKIKKLNFDQKHAQELKKDFLEIKKQIEEKISEKEKLLQKVGSLENELKRIEKQKQQSKERTERLKVVWQEIEDYQQLAQAFGKNGIQALLIEDAIPQIEEEANSILGRLTDNQSQVFIESLRDLKSGGVKETLDIQISDSAGIRPYEMFSGGEAFRVDFALRIAISKLLARRAGTALQTLIIDEGFGSQDEDGLTRLMEAIYAIAGDFSKIIVVSHLSSFKDNFPVHFLIEKNASGSFISVEERG
jgi:DNA repair protein SbcC/Rad50